MKRSSLHGLLCQGCLFIDFVTYVIVNFHGLQSYTMNRPMISRSTSVGLVSDDYFTGGGICVLNSSALLCKGILSSTMLVSRGDNFLIPVSIIIINCCSSLSHQITTRYQLEKFYWQEWICWLKMYTASACTYQQ